MYITLYSILMANLFVVVFALVFFILRNNISFILKIGTNSMILLFGICLVRIIFPFEFSFTKEICLPKLMNWWNHILYLHIAGTNIQCIDIVTSIWLLVASVLLVHYTAYYLKLKRIIRYIPSITNEIIENEISKRYSGNRIKYFFVSQKAIHTPLVFGIINPIILFPDLDYSTKDLEHICHHEITHILNNDNLIKLLCKIITCIFWWNPFCYLLLHELISMQEYKCDYMVTHHLSDYEKALYLETLLKVYAATGNKIVSQFVSAFNAKTSDLFNRFQLISHFNKPSIIPSIASVLVCIVLFLGSYCIVVQPCFDPPYEEGTLDDTNSYLIKINEEQYEVIIDGELFYIVTTQQAELMHENGIPYWNEY